VGKVIYINARSEEVMRSWLFSLFIMLTCLSPQQLDSQKSTFSQKIVDSFIRNNPDTIRYAGVPRSARWDYERGVVLQGVYQVYLSTGNAAYLQYLKKQLDIYIQDDGSIRTYDYSSFNIDNIATGRQLLALFKATGEKKYKVAADTLRKQLAHQPRTNEGGFWHKKIYPYQMWLDGLYMGEPFYVEYAQMFNEPKSFDDIANQFIWVERHTRDEKTGLLYHAWDESRQMKWANKQTGQSPHFWSRALGWYLWALVDVLDYFPLDHPQQSKLIAILKRLSSALIKYREPKTGLWYQVLDQGARPGNYLESSGSCMFIYALAKGSQKGYLDASYRTIAEQSFKSLLATMVTVDAQGLVNLRNACQGAGLGGNPYRDGSYEYYISEKQRTNDFKALGPFILAALELEKPFTPNKQGKGR
jgi:unsaturated rhamnogalacturonyl hydrolase